MKLIICPWCEGGIIIEKINCKIFRHAYMNGKQINPHLKNADVEKIKDKIIGCGNQFYYNGKEIYKYDEEKRQVI
jgi:hypothetical protein